MLFTCLPSRWYIAALIAASPPHAGQWISVKPLGGMCIVSLACLCMHRVARGTKGLKHCSMWPILDVFYVCFCQMNNSTHNSEFGCCL